MSDAPVGSRFGPYVVEARLGAGGMGAVYRARHSETGVVHALKTVHSHLSTTGDFARFRREMQTLARLDHVDGIVRVFAYGMEGDTPWAAMELVEGESLGKRIASGPLPVREAVGIVAVLARALEEVHQLGVLHRDVKPSNVIVDAAGRPCLIDFGLARVASASRLTATGETLGSPGYMAPEQVELDASADEVGPRTDVYGLGALLYGLLIGRPPVNASGGPLAIVAVLTEWPEPPSRYAPEIPPVLDAICLQALHKAAGPRPRSAAALAELLERWLAGAPVVARAPGRVDRLKLRIRRRRRAVATGSLLIAAAVAAVAFFAAGGAPRSLTPAHVGTIRDRLARHGAPLEPDELRGLEATAATAEASDDARSRAAAARLLLALNRVLTSEAGAADGLAELVRRDAPPSLTDVDLVATVLARASRFAELDRFLHRHEPVIPSPQRSARALARSYLDPGAPLPPVDPAALAALVAPRVGLQRDERGRVLARAARHAVEAGDATRALELHREALHNGVIADDPGGFPTPVRAAGVRLVVDLLLRGEIEEAEGVAALVVGAPGDARELPVDDGVALLEAVRAALPDQAGRGGADLRPISLGGALLLRHGLDPAWNRWGGAVLGGLDPAELQAEIEDLLRRGERAPSTRRPLFAARATTLIEALIERAKLFLDNLWKEWRPTRSPARDAPAWVTTIEGWGLEPPWLLLGLARALERWALPPLDRPAAWLKEHAELYRRADALFERVLDHDRTLPDPLRWPLVPYRLARVRTSELERSREAYPLHDPVAAAALIVEAARIQRATLPRAFAIVDGLEGARRSETHPQALAGWQQIISFGARLTNQLIFFDVPGDLSRLARVGTEQPLPGDGPLRCCGGGGDAGPGLAELLASLEALHGEDAVRDDIAERRASARRWLNDAVLASARARHAVRHERWDEALAAADDAVARARSVETGPPARSLWINELCIRLEWRALLHRRLGNRDAERADLDEKEKLREELR